MWDARHIFQGDHPTLRFDFTNMGKVCMHVKEEFQTNDVVAVIHSVFIKPIYGVQHLQFGIYDVVLLARDE